MAGHIRWAAAIALLCGTSTAFGQAYKDVLALGQRQAKEGQLAAAIETFKIAYDEARRSGQGPAVLAQVLWFQADTEVDLKKPVEAIRTIERALVLLQNVKESPAELRAKLHWERAIALHLLHRYSDAMADHDQAVRLTPQWSNAHYSRAYCLHQLKRYPEALEAVDECLKLRKGSNAWKLRGQLNLELKNPEGAVVDLFKAAQADPANLDICLWEARAQAAAGQYERAYRTVNIAWRMAPKSQAVLRLQSYIIDQRIEHDPEHIRLTQALAKNPDDVELLFARGRLRRQMRNQYLALEDLNKALKLKPDHLGALRERGFEYVWMDKPAEAAPDLERVLKADPGDVLARLAWCLLLEKTGRQNEVARTFAAAMEGKPRDAETYAMRGHRLLALDRPREAVADFTAAMKLEPKDGLHRYFRARALDEMAIVEGLKLPKGKLRNEYQTKTRFESIAELKALAKADPSLRSEALTDAARKTYAYHSSRPWDPVHNFWFGRGDDGFPALITDINVAIDYDPRMANAYIWRGLCFLTVGFQKEAQADLRLGVRLDPSMANETASLVKKAEARVALNKELNGKLYKWMEDHYKWHQSPKYCSCGRWIPSGTWCGFCNNR